MRLGEKLRTEIDLDESALREQIPVLSIEPLVENAVKHGVSARPQGGCVRIEVKREEDGVRVSVTDTGPGFGSMGSEGSRGGAGVGLDNVSRRLSLCYGPAARVSIESTSAGSRVSFFAPCEKQAVVSV
jgi:two-component system LytT family sensor kinase